MKLNRIVCVLLIAFAACLGLSACAKEDKPDFSGYKKVAELATLECVFHNVAEIYNDGTDVLFGINVGYKKAWFEYDGKVVLGIDVSKVSIEDPDENGVVVVHIPDAQIIGLPDADPSTFSELYFDKGFFVEISAAEQAEALKLAQEEMRNSAENDSDLMDRARSHAKAILEQYVIQVGKAVGQSYKVEFRDVK